VGKTCILCSDAIPVFVQEHSAGRLLGPRENLRPVHLGGESRVGVSLLF